MCTISNRNLQILQVKEIEELYSIPNFDIEDRITYLSLSTEEYALMQSFRGVSSKVFFVLQLGYFKAKHLFFIFDLVSHPLDVEFVLSKYFNKRTYQDLQQISKPTRLYQRQVISNFLGYKFFETSFLASVLNQATIFAKRHNHPVYLFRSLLHYFHNRKVILPAYSFLQRKIISKVVKEEQNRVEKIISKYLAQEEKVLLDSLLEKPNEGLYLFTQLQKEPSSFQYHQIRTQLKYANQLKPIYKIVLKLNERMDFSYENIRYYGQLAENHSPFRLRQLQSNMRYVYLLCFAYNRYRFINDILVEALKYNVLNLEKSAVEFAIEKINSHHFVANNSLAKVPKVLELLKNKELGDEIAFGVIRKMAFSILSLKEMSLAVDLIKKNKPDKKKLIGLFYKKKKRLISLYLRPIATHFELNNAAKCDAIVEAINFIDQQIQSGKSFSKIPQDELPISFLSKKQKKIIKNEQGVIDFPKYEMILYQSLRNKIESGDIFVSDSFKNRSFEQDLIDKENWKTDKINIVKSVDLPKLNKSVEQILEEWKSLIDPLYKRVNNRIRKGLNPSIKIDGKHKDGSIKWHLIYTQTDNSLNHDIYQQFTPIDISSLLQLVNNHTNFLNAFTHLFPSNVSRKIDTHKLIACIVAFGTNYGIGQMASISDMSYQDLESTSNTLMYLEVIKEANNKIVNQTMALPMYRYYNLEPDIVHSSSDGQKYYTQIPTINSRFSPKYFGLAKGISSLTVVADYIPINAQIIGANEHESHYVFDLLYNNDTHSKPDIHSTDSHGINQVNFGILDMFGYRFAPRYKDISSKIKTIYSFQSPSEYKDYVIKPIRKFKEDIIIKEWDNFQRIIASLAQKNTSQSTIVKKLSSFKRNNGVRKSILEYNAMVETYHKLSYIDSPKFQKQIHTSLNRGEHMNKLRKHYFHANGGKFRVHTIVEQKIWNECNRLLANATIYYNTWLLSELLKRYKSKRQLTQIELIKKVSPIAWQHIHIHGRYTFKIKNISFNAEDIISHVEI